MAYVRNVMAKYKCIICNQIIEVPDGEELETCPICGVGKELFKKI